MRRLKLTIEYKGTRYHGWQRQRNATGVQSVVEDALSAVLNERVALVASGRTDIGVHAYGQVAHFDTCAGMHTGRLPSAANSQLPPDIRILACEEVPPDFSARFSAKTKTYLYKAYVSKVASPLRSDTHWQVEPPLDLERMRRAAAHFVGEHDFTSFMSRGSTPLNGHVRRILRFDIDEIKSEFPAFDNNSRQTSDVRRQNIGQPELFNSQFPILNSGEIWFWVTGTGFLYNMVRVMVMAAVNAGRGKLDPDGIPKILANKDRAQVKELAPAKGLYLYGVEY